MNDQPLISIIIPTFNRHDRLVVCLRGLCEMDYPAERFETIVVDDGSDNSLRPTLEPFDGSRLNITLLSQDNAGPAKARNTGAARARGRFLAFTDDDCVPAKGWLKTLERSLTAAPNHLIGGKTINALTANRFASASQVITDAVYAYYNHEDRPHFFASNNLALQTKLFADIGGFDCSFPRAASEDREFCDRWISRGNPTTYAPHSVVYHRHELTFRGFCRQHFNYGRGASQLHRMRASGDGEPIKLDVRFYLELLAYPFRHYPAWTAIQWAGLIGVQQTCKTAGFFWERLYS